ncbi:MAG: hypothetical protein LUD19_03035 [Clostridia bacterium]|nr:hypothetical protein [Clostridia bacterium]
MNTEAEIKTTAKPDRPCVPIYRMCKGCHTEWNVSVLDMVRREKYYYCPYCRAKMARGERLQKK